MAYGVIHLFICLKMNKTICNHSKGVKNHPLF